MHIAISGNIGSGKTTLTEKLCKHYKWKPQYESVEKNPYLEDFYTDMRRWAFHLQIFFLNSRFNQIKKIQESDETTVQDRTIYEDAYIFAAYLHEAGHISERDYQNYLDIFHSMIGYVKAPDLLIYLKSDIPKLVHQIEKRGREFEYAMPIDYLRNLNKYYEKWMKGYDLGKLLIINVDPIDFVENVEDFSEIINKVELELHGLFS